MRTKVVLSVLCIILAASRVQAQTRVSAKVDATDSSVADQELNWRGIEFEAEHGFKRNKLLLSGFAAGIRKESERWDEGVYLSFRTFRREELSGFQIIPSITVLWGSPGLTLNRATQERYGEFVPYKRIFPLRNAEVPGFDIENAGLIYPELSVAVRKTFFKNLVSIEPVLGVRVIKFGIAEYDGVNSGYRKDTAFLPSLGLRVGLKIN